VKVFLAVVICKILYFIGKKVGRGSSLPGKIVLKLFPDILQRLELPETIIAVTGSNGKTTTTELIVHTLEASGKKVGWNYEGSNQTEGVATLLLRTSSLGGRVNRDAIVMECDERYTVKIFENVRPTVLLVTNLVRDQITRNGHLEFIEDRICASIEAAGDTVMLVMNADDPYVSALSYGVAEHFDGRLSQGENEVLPARNNVLWFGVTSDSVEHPHVGMYDDGAFCPLCKARMTYLYRIAGHFGSYSCAACGLKRADPEVEVSIKRLGFLSFGESIKLKVKHPGITSAYNFCAAVAVAKAAGLSVAESVKALNDYELTSGRVLRLPTGGSDDLLLLSKHENSFAYNNSMSWIVQQKKPCTVIILVEDISRKYYTSETSWFWDIDFELLADESVKCIVLAGRYINELAMRFAMSVVDQSKINYITDLSDLRGFIDRAAIGSIYAVTCFSDKVKLQKALES